MKSDWANLPQEIILHILQYASQSPQFQPSPLQSQEPPQIQLQQHRKQYDQHQKQLQQHEKQLLCLQFINKNWGRAARTLYYETIKLYKSKKQVDIVLKTLESPKNKLLSQAVRKISLGANGFPDEQNLRALLKICSNVTEIVTRSDDRNELNYYYRLLSELRKEGYLQRLKKVDAPSTIAQILDRSLITEYQDTMLSLAATVTELCIDSIFKVADSSTELFPPVAKHLADFASLKRLKIDVPHKVSLNEVSNLFVDNQPPQLNSLDLSLYTETPLATYPANDICALPQVELVSLQLHFLSAQDLCFIMRMFPNLKELLIESFDQTNYLPRVNDSTSTLTFKRFSEYISRIPELEIWRLVMSPEVLLESIASLAEFNKLAVVRICLTHIGVADEVELKVARFKNEAYACDDQDKTPCQVDMDTYFEATYHLRLMALLADTADRLTIEADAYLLYQSATTVKYEGCLDYILSHCTTLGTLDLKGLDINFSSSDDTINPLDKRDFSHLTLQKCQVSLDAFRYMSQRIRKVGVFTVSESAYHDEDDEYYEEDGNDGYDSGFEAVQIDMPYTVFDTFNYVTEWHDFAVKICSCTKTVVFRVSNENKIQRFVGGSPYICNFASSARNFHTLTICCNDMATFSVKGGDSIKI